MKPSFKPRTSTAFGVISEHQRRSLLPFTFRFNIGIRLTITLLLGFLVALIGTSAHRMGAADNIPYGLVLALILIGISAWQARARNGVIGLAVHLIASSLGAGMLAGQGPMGDVLVPVGGAAFTTFFGLHVGYFWLLGLIIVQCVIVFLPAAWFHITPRLASTVSPSSEETAHDTRDDSASQHEVMES